MIVIRRNAIRASKCAEVGHHAVLPPKSMQNGVTGWSREASYPTSIINAVGLAECPAQGAEVGDDVVLEPPPALLLFLCGQPKPNQDALRSE
jgi:hypothetical protein